MFEGVVKRTLPLLAAGALIGLLALPPSAGAIGQGGHNKPTNRLEGAFKVALYWRSQDPQGCYLSPSRMASEIRKRGNLKAGVAPSDNAVRRAGIVFVVRKGTNCNHLRMALRARQGLYVLDTDVGPVELKGREGQSLESRIGGRGPLRAITFATQRFKISKPDIPDRFDIRCPGRTFPLGGGAVTSPAIESDGAGAYPHSYERLGVQRGWHVSEVLFDPTPLGSTPREVTLQVVCGKGLVPTSSPHRTVYMRSGQTKTAVARCTGGRKLFGGGFQRNNWISTGGSYVTESRAVGTKAWMVTGTAFARWGGELTAIAYCAKDKSLPLTEVSASVPIAAGTPATATTPACPAGRTLTSGGFSTNGSPNAFFGDGSINRDGTWSATAYGFFGAVPSFTAYGYCLKAKG
jgi:hypothetical protein